MLSQARTTSQDAGSGVRAHLAALALRKHRFVRVAVGPLLRAARRHGCGVVFI
jgi:hypothetical protein